MDTELKEMNDRIKHIDQMRVGQKINELNEDCRSIVNQVTELMAENTMATAPTKTYDFHKVILSLGKAMTEIGKAYQSYQLAIEK